MLNLITYISAGLAICFFFPLFSLSLSLIVHIAYYIYVLIYIFCACLYKTEYVCTSCGKKIIKIKKKYIKIVDISLYWHCSCLPFVFTIHPYVLDIVCIVDFLLLYFLRIFFFILFFFLFFDFSSFYFPRH